MKSTVECDTSRRVVSSELRMFDVEFKSLLRSTFRIESESSFIVQRFDETWQSLVDMDDGEALVDRDKFNCVVSACDIPSVDQHDASFVRLDRNPSSSQSSTPCTTRPSTTLLVPDVDLDASLNVSSQSSSSCVTPNSKVQMADGDIPEPKMSTTLLECLTQGHSLH